MMSRLERMICTSCDTEVQATLSALALKVQKYCNRHSSSPPPLKVAIVGPEGYLRSVLKGYVEQFSQKPSEFQSYLRFLLIPLGSHRVASYIGSIDRTYNSLFLDTFWRTWYENSPLQEKDMSTVENRILQYVKGADIVQGIPIAEALITYKMQDGESSQLYIPFTTDVRIGGSQTDVDAVDEVPQYISPYTSSKDIPIPNSDKLANHRDSGNMSSSPGRDTTDKSFLSGSSGGETLDLQVDYWPVVSTAPAGKREEKKEGNKLSIKSTFRSLVVSRLPNADFEDTNGLSFIALTRSRSKGVKRLMKPRDKDTEAKTSVSALVSKLVCTARSHGQTFSVAIDGMEWAGVKFFSLSYQWPTHIKQFPIAMFYCSDGWGT